MSFFISHFQCTRAASIEGAGSRRGRKTGLLRRFRTTWSTWLAMILVTALLAPTLVTASMMMTQGNSDHELRCHITGEGVSITLAHQHDTAAPTQRSHRHNGLEQLLLSRPSNDSEHPDHQFSFSLASVLDIQKETAISGTTPPPASLLPIVEFAPQASLGILTRSYRVSVSSSGSWPDLPHTIRRGTVQLC